MQQSKASKAIERTLLKSLLPSIVSNAEWQKWVGLLGRAAVVVFDKAHKKEKKPKCVVCAQPYENYLLLVLHLELTHKVLPAQRRIRLKSSSTSSCRKVC
jgi:hypothetical protein